MVTKTVTLLPVREITKSSSTFSATNVRSNIVWFLPLHDNFVWISFLVPNLVAIISQKEKKCLVFRLSFVNLQRAKDGTHVIDAKYKYVFFYKSHQIARLVSHLINNFSKWMFTM